MDSKGPKRFKDEHDDEVLRGQYHGHPCGELNMVIPIDKWCRTQGPPRLAGAGWTAPDPGTATIPRSRGEPLSGCSIFLQDGSRMISNLRLNIDGQLCRPGQRFRADRYLRDHEEPLVR
jgi:Domain of unknown function (DUF4863)